MRYVIFVERDDQLETYTAPVPDDDAAYLKRVMASLRPLSQEAYLNGPAVILHSLAPYNYVLDGQDLYWCVEWPPGLLVVRFAPGGDMAWCMLRSPVPDFGGRVANDSEWDDYDEDAPNPQYNLVFDPWDAQLDHELRQHQGFSLVDEETEASVQQILDTVSALTDAAEERAAENPEVWFQRCTQNLEAWGDQGLRIR